MTRKSGPRRLDHWLAGSDRSPKADRLTTVRFRSRRHRRWPPSNAGRLGAELSAAEGSMAGGGGDADLLANLKAEVGDLSPSHRFEKVVVNSAPHYTEQHLVADGATDLLVRAFGNRIGRPARSAVVVAGLPLGFAVEVEDIVEAAPKTSGYPRTAPDLGFMTN
jgi:hypothetical protein